MIGTDLAIGDRRVLGPDLWTVEVAGHPLVVKAGPGVTDEAEGLKRLAGVGGAPPVPAVVANTTDLLVTTWVDQAHRSPAHEEALGRMLATLHAAPWREWGGGSSWVGACPLTPSVETDAPSLYAVRFSDLASRCGMADQLSGVIDRLDRLIPPGSPSLVHGDLWWGNVLWGADGRPWLIDPSVHGGHPEEDLAMLGLFGDVPARTLRAYDEVRPLEDGWEQRVDLFRLYPLLVHAVLFGGSYRSRTEAIAGRLAGRS